MDHEDEDMQCLERVEKMMIRWMCGVMPKVGMYGIDFWNSFRFRNGFEEKPRVRFY